VGEAVIPLRGRMTFPDGGGNQGEDLDCASLKTERLHFRSGLSFHTCAIAPSGRWWHSAIAIVRIAT
jgi:hypothetical protein